MDWDFPIQLVMASSLRFDSHPLAKACLKMVHDPDVYIITHPEMPRYHQTPPLQTSCRVSGVWFSTTFTHMSITL